MFGSLYFILPCCTEIVSNRDPRTELSVYRYTPNIYIYIYIYIYTYIHTYILYIYVYIYISAVKISALMQAIHFFSLMR